MGRTERCESSPALPIHDGAGTDFALPVDTLTGSDHGLGQVKHLVAVEFELIGRDDEGRQFDPRVARRRDVLNDGAQVVSVQPRAARIASHNAAVDEQTDVATRFNAALQAFKTRN